MSNRNRSAGNNFELIIINELKEMGYEAVSTRAESRNADARGIDIITDLPFNPQCKISINQPNIHKLLTETDTDLIFYRRVVAKDYKQKNGKTKRTFVKDGDYVMMEKSAFYNLIKKIKDNE